MAKVAKELEIRGRQIYKPESRQCSGCGGAIELQDYYQWRKTVQHLSGAIYVASWGGVCINPECRQKDDLVTSLVAQSPDCLISMYLSIGPLYSGNIFKIIRYIVGQKS